MYLSNTFRWRVVVTGLLAAAAVLPLAMSNPASAASIIWGDVFDIAGLGDLNTNGTFIEAINGGDGSNSLVTIGDIVFTPSQATFPNGTGDGGYFTGGGGDVGDADLNLVLDSHAYGPSATTLTLGGLTVGQDYELQLIAAADTRGCCSARTLAGSDGVNISGDMMRGGPGSVIGSFTADASTQDFMVVPGTVSPTDPGLSAYVLRSTSGGSTNASIDRISGNLTLTNNTVAPLDILGYAVRSSYGALYQTHWNTITGNSDSDGNGSIDVNDPWTILTDPASHTDLSEAELAGGDGGEIAIGQTVDFGNVWIQSPTEDVRLQLLRGDGTVQTVGVGYTGNGGESLQVGDLDFNGLMDVNDWATFLTGLSADLSALSPAEAYQVGDLVGNDLLVNHADFKAFKLAFDDANGAGAFAAMVAGVPEPTTAGILLIGMMTLCLGVARRRVSRQAIRITGVFVAAAALSAASIGQAETILGTGAASLVGMDLTDQDDIHDEGAYPPGGFDATFFANDEPGFGGGEFAFNVFDNAVGGGNDKWCCGTPDGVDAFPMIVGATFGQPYSLTSFTLASGNDTEARRPAVWAIEGSNNTTDGFDGDWTTVYNRTGSGSSDWTEHNQVIRYSPADGDSFLTTERFSSFRMSTTETAGGGTTGAYFQLNEIEFFGESALLTLEVNIADGSTAIKNADSEDFNFDLNYYTITSASGSLDPNGWNSLDDQNLDAVDGTDPGSDAGDSLLEGWDEAASENLTSSVLTEAFLLGHSTIGMGERIGIGNPYNEGVGGAGGGSAEDLVFQYGLASGAFVTGLVEYIDVPPAHDADFNDDGIVDGDDFLIWQSGFGGPGDQFTGDANGDDVVDGDDFLQWQADFGGPPSGAASAAVPEPSTLGLLGMIFAGLAIGFSRRKAGGRIMDSGKCLLSVAAVILTISATAFASSTNDRVYRLGDDDNTSAGNTSNGTNDAAAPADDLFGSGNPTYVNVGPGGAGRPGAGSNELGLEFDGDGDYFDGARLGLPSTSSSSSTEDYSGISNRGFQLWINPSVGASAEDQHIVMDTLQHGVGISASGNWFMQYAGSAHDTGIAVSTGAWSHVMVVRPFGAGGGSRMYLDGNAVSVAAGGYTGSDDPFNLPLVLGANTGDFDPDFPGTSNFFTGTLDDLDMFVLGTSTDTQTEYGTFNAAEDNDFIAGAVGGLPDGDVDMNGTLDPVADVNAFVGGWLSQNIVNGVTVGDLSSRANGDLNIDGITDLKDAFVLHEALVAGGFGGLAGFGFKVPEPTSAVLVLVGLFGLSVVRRRTTG